MIQVEWEKSALDRHEAWALSIALEFTAKHATSYLNDIQNAITNIESNPFVGTEHASPERKNLRRLVTGGRYNVFYELDSIKSPSQAVIISVVRGSKS